jgi:hypothetical protein
MLVSTDEPKLSNIAQGFAVSDRAFVERTRTVNVAVSPHLYNPSLLSISTLYVAAQTATGNANARIVPHVVLIFLLLSSPYLLQRICRAPFSARQETADCKVSTRFRGHSTG